LRTTQREIAGIVSRGGAPVRVWIDMRPDSNGADIALGPAAREILGIGTGETVVIRSPLRAEPASS
jgi:hypothetical protein